MLSPDDSSGALPATPAGLRALAALTARMLVACDHQDWALLSDLEAQRAELLNNLPATYCAVERESAQEVLRDALAATQRITERVRAVQVTERQALAALRNGSRGARSYLDVATAP